jgi:ribosome-associated translation inhibitor RaiA
MGSSELQITFRGMAPNAELREVVQQKFDKTARLFRARASCRVVLDRAASSRKNGTPVSARVELYGLGQRSPVAVQASHLDPAAAVRDAFERVQRLCTAGM